MAIKLNLLEFCNKYHIDVVEEYERYSNSDALFPIGTKVITVRAGFGGIGDDERVIRGYYDSHGNHTDNPANILYYWLGYDMNSGAFLSKKEDWWKDFRVVGDKK
jgi:hypothetical protein